MQGLQRWQGHAGNVYDRAGLTKNTKLIAVNGTEFSGEVFKDAITVAKDPKKPVNLLIKDGKNFRTVSIEHSGLSALRETWGRRRQSRHFVETEDILNSRFRLNALKFK
jgi:hypothetical protein